MATVTFFFRFFFPTSGEEEKGARRGSTFSRGWCSLLLLAGDDAGDDHWIAVPHPERGGERIELPETLRATG